MPLKLSGNFQGQCVSMLCTQSVRGCTTLCSHIELATRELNKRASSMYLLTKAAMDVGLSCQIFLLNKASQAPRTYEGSFERAYRTAYGVVIQFAKHGPASTSSDSHSRAKQGSDPKHQELIKPANNVDSKYDILQQLQQAIEEQREEAAARVKDLELKLMIALKEAEDSKARVQTLVGTAEQAAKEYNSSQAQNETAKDALAALGAAAEKELELKIQVAGKEVDDGRTQVQELQRVAAGLEAAKQRAVEEAEAAAAAR
eukprot:369521-Pelagomonas_calceolata.AAC.1